MNYVVDDIGTVVASLRGSFDASFDKSFGVGWPFYMYGHRGEIASRLSIRGKDGLMKTKRYPLIALRLDTPEVIADGFQNYTLNIIIVTLTAEKYIAEERYANVIKPVLMPIYESFLAALSDSGLFQWDNDENGDNDLPPHTKIDRPFWGTAGTGEVNAKTLFNDPLDAIEITDLKIRSRIKCRPEFSGEF